MPLTRLALWIVICFGLSALTVSAAGAAGGGGGPGLGGANRGGNGPDLNKTFRKGTELLAAGDCKKAERNFRTVLKAVKRNPEANYLRGLSLQCQGKHKAAARYLEKATRYDEKMYAAYEKLGVSYLALGEAGDAQSQLGRLEAFKEDCDGECPERLLSALENLTSRIAGADSDATDSSAEHSPEQAPQESSREDAREGEHSLLFNPLAEPQAGYLSAVQRINSERFEQAIAELRELTSTIGPHPDVLNYLGYAHRRLGQFDRAQAYYEQALAIAPLHRGANEYLGEMWVELGRLEEARQRLAALDQACPFGCAEYEDLKRIIESRVVAAH